MPSSPQQFAFWTKYGSWLTTALNILSNMFLETRKRCRNTVSSKAGVSEKWCRWGRNAASGWFRLTLGLLSGREPPVCLISSSSLLLVFTRYMMKEKGSARSSSSRSIMGFSWRQWALYLPFPELVELLRGKLNFYEYQISFFIVASSIVPTGNKNTYLMVWPPLW